MQKAGFYLSRLGDLWRIKSTWDYGPLGSELKFNIKQEWWKAMVKNRDDVVGINASIIMNPKVWETSGHVAGFNDPLIECKTCLRDLGLTRRML